MSLVAFGSKLEGLPETFRALGRIDPELRKAALSNVRKVGQLVQAEARRNVPTLAPMSGWERGRRSNSKWRWLPGRVRSGIRVKAGTGSVKTGNIRLLRVIQGNPIGSIYDMAGRKSKGKTPAGRQMVANLNVKGNASRTMWPAAIKMRPEVETALRAAVEDMERTVRRLAN